MRYQSRLVYYCCTYRSGKVKGRGYSIREAKLVILTPVKVSNTPNFQDVDYLHIANVPAPEAYPFWNNPAATLLQYFKQACYIPINLLTC